MSQYYNTESNKNLRIHALTAEEERIGKAIVSATFRVDRELGSGLLKKVYETCLFHLLCKDGFLAQRQLAVSLVFDDIEFGESLRLVLMVNDFLICERKAVETVNPVAKAAKNDTKATWLPYSFQCASHST